MIPENKSFANQEIKENFERMLRVVFNLLENTRLESVAPAVRRIKQLHDLCIQPGATDVNFYKVLAAPTKENIRAQRYEEILKAREMFDNDGNFLPEWEKAFITAERHPFFKGSILFFFTEKAGDSQDFLNRYNVVKNMFYQNGIHPDYRQPKDHILIRALLGTVNYWENGMKEQFITEGNESKYLKNLIIESEDIRKLFCDFFTQQSFESIDEYLEDSVKNASPKEGESDDFGRLFRRLINSDTSSAIFDWIQDGEEATRHNANHTFAARESKGIYYLNIKRNNYQLVLSNERHLIIPYFVNCHGFSFADKQQESSINGPLGDVTGWNIYLDKQLVCQSGEKYKVQLIFIWDQLAEFRVYGPEIGRLSTEFKVNPEHAHEGYIQISWIRHHLAADKVAIENELKRIEDILIHKF